MLETDWRTHVLGGYSQFGVIGRVVPPRLMLQRNPSSDPEDYRVGGGDRKAGQDHGAAAFGSARHEAFSAALWGALREGRTALEPAALGGTQAN
jgi:hypothetical protein